MTLRLLLSKFLLVTGFVLTASQITENDIDSFLEKSAVRIDSLEFAGNITKFLNYKIEKKKPIWFQGTIHTHKDEIFSDLDLNFNVLDNSLYVLNDNIVYRVSNSVISKFQIQQEGRQLRFQKGYGIPFDAVVTGKFDGTAQELLNLVSSYSDLKALLINKMSISENEKVDFTIELGVGFRSQIINFKKYFLSNEKIVSLDAEYITPELGENIYFQVLYENEHLQLLKYHFKRNATAEPISVVKTTSSFLFDDDDYFIADSKKHIRELHLTRKAIEKALSQMKLSYSEKPKSVSNESRTIKWLDTTTFYRER